jgi:hypothetical protein
VNWNKILCKQLFQPIQNLVLINRSFSSDVTAAILVYQNNEMAAILVYGTGISSFLFKYFVLFHQPTGATDHVSENDLYVLIISCFRLSARKIARIKQISKIVFTVFTSVIISFKIENSHEQKNVHFTKIF